MNKPLCALLIPFLCLGAVPILHAEETSTNGNSTAGKEKAVSCAGCHSENGNSVMATFPKLAGQHPGYLINQLQAFKDGVRNDPVMTPIAMALSDEDRGDIAAYYSSQTITDNPAPGHSADEDNTTAEETAKESRLTL